MTPRIEVGRIGARRMPENWRAWFRKASPGLVAFAPHHEEAGEWLQAIEPGVRPAPEIDIWARGHGKSSFAELGTSFLAERRKRRFALYLCDTQDAADRHLQSIQAILERIGGDVGRRLENQYGHSKGWRKSMLRTASGFSAVALGFDVAMRGIKLEDYRPDLIIFDDIDGRHDTAATTKKKIEILTESILPAGSADCAIWGVQNLITPNGIFAQLADGRADFLATRNVRGPVKAIEGLRTEDREVEGRVVKWITGGEATWPEGMPIETCQRFIIDFGWRSFDREMQHNVKDVEGALWTTDLINSTRVKEAPPLTRIVVAVDPATTSKDSSDETGIGAIGRTADHHGYVLEDQSGHYSPAEWGRRAVRLHDNLGADCIVIEDNQGGEMAEHVVTNAARKLFEEKLRKTPSVRVKRVHASKAKRARAEPVAQMYEEGMIHHVGDLRGLEEQMTTWDASDGSESPDRVDWLVWGATELGIVKQAADWSGITLSGRRI